MLDPQNITKNVERWALFHPIEARQLPNLKCQRISFHRNVQGDLNLKTVIEGVPYFFHSCENPLEEAENQFKALNLKKIELIYVYGVGLGYFYEAAKAWLHENPDHYLVFFENDLEVIYHFLQTERGKELLFDRQVWLTYVDSTGKGIEAITANFLLNTHLFITLGLYSVLYKEAAAALKSKLDFFIHWRVGYSAEFSDYGRRFYANYFRNLFELPHTYFGNKLFNQFKGIPAIICGAGPSLAKQLSLLKTLKENALILAGGTAMNALNTAGILPHFGVGIDPNPAQFTRLIMNQAYEVPYFYRNRMNYKALNIIHGPHLYISGSAGYHIYQYFEEKFGLSGEFLSEGFNVINFSLSIAHALGCNPIIFVGLDLAYTDSLSYCPGILSHPLHDRRQNFVTKSYEEELINHLDYRGQPVLTLWKWISESLWFTNFARNNPETSFYNATEGGIAFPGIMNVSLTDLATQRLKCQFDIQARVHSAIQQATLPKSLDRAAVVQSINEILESLKRCQNQSKLACENYEDEDGQRAIEGLKTETAFPYILQDFYQTYEDIYRRDYERLRVDEELMPKAEQQEKKISLEKGRYRFIFETTTAIIKIIESLLREQEGATIPSLNPSKVPVSAKPQESMLLEDTVPPEAENHREFYPNQGLKIDQYFFNGLLHGPSTYYSEDGHILSRHNFIHGLQQGKAWKYYLDGSVASLQHFRDGQWDGLQEFYYPNGSIKSEINYANGVLDGAVRLYYPSGKLHRELHFVKGQREGYDRIMNNLGLMVMEAQFHEDQGVGTARQWFDSGNLEKEVVYHDDSQEYSVREWRENGAIRVTYKGVQGDYFDHVSLQTQKLTGTLEKISEQIQAILPMIGGGVSDDLVNTVALELKHLEEINKKLMFETGLDAGNKQESIWKSPSRKLEVEEQIEKLASMMSREMVSLQRKLSDTFNKLGAKIKKEQSNGK